jgi:c-di-GMP-binding flagellar brake protein YcgR
MNVDHAPRDRERRREPRTHVSRAASFLLLNHRERGWGSCKIADFSRSGAGLVLFGPPWPRYRSERRLLIRLDADEATCDPHVDFLEVLVRNTSATEEGRLRVGVEFVALTAGQHATAMEWARLLLSGT